MSRRRVPLHARATRLGGPARRAADADAAPAALPGGDFGPLTAQAVATFQHLRDLAPTGVVDAPAVDAVIAARRAADPDDPGRNAAARAILLVADFFELPLADAALFARADRALKKPFAVHFAPGGLRVIRLGRVAMTDQGFAGGAMVGRGSASQGGADAAAGQGGLVEAQPAMRQLQVTDDTAVAFGDQDILGSQAGVVEYGGIAFGRAAAHRSQDGHHPLVVTRPPVPVADIGHLSLPPGGGGALARPTRRPGREHHCRPRASRPIAGMGQTDRRMVTDVPDVGGRPTEY
jgi:hypothetical protein